MRTFLSFPFAQPKRWPVVVYLVIFGMDYLIWVVD